MKSGFTLLELVIVIALIGTLTTTMVGSFGQSFQNISSSNEMSQLSSAIDQLKAFAYSAYSLEDASVEHTFGIEISKSSLRVFENLVGSIYFEDGDRSLLSVDFEDPATKLVTGKAFQIGGDAFDYRADNNKIVMGLYEGALDCLMNPDQALSVELLNPDTSLELGYLYLNPNSCHLEIIQNNLHAN